MPTTVRLRDEDKQIIDRIQATYRITTGKRISIEHLMSLIIETAEQHEDEIIMDDKPRKFSPQEIEAFEAGSSDWGVETKEEDIDDILYGGEDAA